MLDALALLDAFALVLDALALLDAFALVLDASAKRFCTDAQHRRGRHQMQGVHGCSVV
jgi:hypothetical protein